jgi:hypothetical protein
MDLFQMDRAVGVVLRDQAAKLRHLADLYATVHGPDCLIVQTLRKSEDALTGVSAIVSAAVAENATSPDGSDTAQVLHCGTD